MYIDVWIWCAIGIYKKKGYRKGMPVQAEVLAGQHAEKDYKNGNERKLKTGGAKINSSSSQVYTWPGKSIEISCVTLKDDLIICFLYPTAVSFAIDNLFRVFTFSVLRNISWDQGFLVMSWKIPAKNMPLAKEVSFYSSFHSTRMVLRTARHVSENVKGGREPATLAHLAASLVFSLKNLPLCPGHQR